MKHAGLFSTLVFLVLLAAVVALAFSDSLLGHGPLTSASRPPPSC
ncbi:MAG: hypothetical protein WAM82_23730 [Thermoanaerobaculia bacterium]